MIFRFLSILLIAAMCASLSPCLGQSNEGREFWFGFMEHRDRGENDMVVMITSRFNTSGTINVSSRGFSQSYTVAANDVTVIPLPRFVETIGSEFINDNGINIISNDDVSVYIHQYFGNRSEASVVLPKSSVGNDYFVIAYTGVDGAQFGGGIYTSEFLIVANEDETTVQYTLAATSQDRNDVGTTHSVTLNKGEVYQVKGLNHLSDLTGSRVSGDKDFSLFAGTTWSQVPLGCTFMDNLFEQMYPISTWGTRYVASPFTNTLYDLYRVIASEDNTTVSIQASTTDVISLDAGQHYDFQSTEGAYIEGDKAISVAQYITGATCNGGFGDPSMVVLNTVEQIRDTVTLFNSRFFEIDENYINVICKNGEEDLIFFDQQQLSNTGVTFLSLGEDADFLYATITTSVGPHTLFTQGCGIIAMAYGYGNLESYAYSGGASFTEINENPIPEGGCLNDTIYFASGLPPDRFEVIWDLGDGTVTQEHEFEHQYDALGAYPLSLIIEDICFDDIDTIYRELMVTLRQDITAIDDLSGCEGTDVMLGAMDLGGASYEWSGPESFESEDQFPIIENIIIEQAGLYEVVGNISGCKTIPADIAVEVFENPSPFLGLDTVLCTVDGDRHVLDPGSYVSYSWQDASTNREFLVATDGIFYVDVSDSNGCVGRDSINIIRQCPTRFYIPNIFSPNDDGINDFFGIVGLEIITFELNVYDRWGQLVFQSTSEDQLWDGTFENQNVASGQYVWRLEYQGYDVEANIFGKVESGTVFLLR